MAEEMMDEKKESATSRMAKNIQKQKVAPSAKTSGAEPKEEKVSTTGKILGAALPTIIGALVGGKRGGAIGAKAGQTFISELDKSEQAARKRAQEEKAEAMQAEELSIKRVTEEAKRRKLKADANLSRAKAYKLMQQEKGQQSYGQKLSSLGASEKKRFDSVVMGGKAVEDMTRALSTGENTFTLWGDNNFTLAAKNFEEALGRMQSGGAINDKEAARFRSFLPTATDSKQIQITKLTKAREMMQQRMLTMGFDPAEVPGFISPDQKEVMANLQLGGSGSLMSTISPKAQAGQKKGPDRSTMSLEELQRQNAERRARLMGR